MATNPDKNIKKNMQNSLSTDLQCLMLLYGSQNKQVLTVTYVFIAN